VARFQCLLDWLRRALDRSVADRHAGSAEPRLKVGSGIRRSRPCRDRGMLCILGMAQAGQVSAVDHSRRALLMPVRLPLDPFRRRTCRPSLRGIRRRLHRRSTAVAVGCRECETRSLGRHRSRDLPVGSRHYLVGPAIFLRCFHAGAPLGACFSAVALGEAERDPGRSKATSQTASPKSDPCIYIRIS
jgi:hypothetical protein